MDHRGAVIQCRVAVRFLEKEWHVYWVNPGDSGEPPRVTWDLPAGITAGAIEWPAPRRLGTASIVDYGYEDAVMLIVPMHCGSEPERRKATQLRSLRRLRCSFAAKYASREKRRFRSRCP